MNLEYKQKYLKYKNKYLNLKLELEGGKKEKPLKNEAPNNQTAIYYLFPRGNQGMNWLSDDYKFNENQIAVKDSKIELPVFYDKEFIYENWDHYNNAMLEYLEKKYGGRFEKGGVFKKGKHLDKKGNYKTHKSGMFSHYPEYFGKLEPWVYNDDVEIEETPEPKILDDGDNILDYMDSYRKIFLSNIWVLLDYDTQKRMRGIYKGNYFDWIDSIDERFEKKILKGRLGLSKKQIENIISWEGEEELLWEKIREHQPYTQPYKLKGENSLKLSIEQEKGRINRHFIRFGYLQRYMEEFLLERYYYKFVEWKKIYRERVDKKRKEAIDYENSGKGTCKKNRLDEIRWNKDEYTARYSEWTDVKCWRPGGSYHRVGCFHPLTKIELADGRIKLIKDIKLDDKLKNGSTVQGTLRLRNVGKEPYIRIKNSGNSEDILVTGSHKVLEQNKEDIFDNYVYVKDYKLGEVTDIIDETVINLIISDHRIQIGEHKFWDWEDGEENLLNKNK